MTGEPQKARVDIDNAVSPCNSVLVLDLVMSYLPIEACVRTSILSSKWRYRWRTIPSLVFDATCRRRSCRFGTVEERKSLANIVNHVLSLHKGPIQNFQYRGPCVAPDIDRWILRVSRYSIKTLVLELWRGDHYLLPSSLYTCGSLSSLRVSNCSLFFIPSSFKGFKNLKCLELEFVDLFNGAFEEMISSCPLLEKLVLNVHEQAVVVRFQSHSPLFTCSSLGSLKLKKCLLRPPSSFEGFKNLKYLELESVTLTNDAFEKIISSCHLLEKPVVIDLQQADSLKINAPNLRDIFIIGDFGSITLEHPMARLSVIYIMAPGCAYNSLLDFFLKLPNIQRLTLDCCNTGYIQRLELRYYCMRYMSGHSKAGCFPFHCKDLYHLAISMDFSFTEDREPTLYLYRSPSNLTELDKRLWGDCYLAIELGVWEENSSKRYYEFEKLQRVNVDNFSGEPEELKFVEFVLGTSPVLEKMTVNTCSDPCSDSYSGEVKWEDVKSIYGFKRASDKAKIIVDGHIVTRV